MTHTVYRWDTLNNYSMKYNDCHPNHTTMHLQPNPAISPANIKQVEPPLKSVSLFPSPGNVLLCPQHPFPGVNQLPTLAGPDDFVLAEAVVRVHRVRGENEDVILAVDRFAHGVAPADGLDGRDFGQAVVCGPDADRNERKKEERDDETGDGVGGARSDRHL